MKYARLRHTLLFYLRILLIAAETALIAAVGFVLAHYWPYANGKHFSVELFFTLPVLQAARLVSRNLLRRHDLVAAVPIGILLSSSWSLTEAFLFRPFPLRGLLVNLVARTVIFIALGFLFVRLWREREYAYTDPLTGLANRIELLERLEAEQERSARSGNAYSLLFLDLDHFKALNDNYGHRTGDEALCLLADILHQNVRKVDVAARMGGDEFVLLLPDTGDEARDQMVARIEEDANLAFRAHDWPISLSTGRVTFRGKEEKPDWVIRAADQSMYAVKHAKQAAGA